MRPSSRQALGRFLTNIDWLVLENVEGVNEKYAFLNNIIIMGMDIIMPAKTIKLRTNDVPWMTGHLKHL
jgi:predicted small integral membrane protein